MRTITIPKMFDAHVHLREGETLRITVPEAARYLARALVMPNVTEAILVPAQLRSYRREILEWLPEDQHASFTPLMTFEVRESTDPVFIPEFRDDGAVAGKVYPYMLTTNAHHGVQNYRKLWRVLEAMQDVGLVLCLHGEQPGLPRDGLQWFRAEPVFIEETLPKIAEAFPGLWIVLEHISTKLATQVVPQLPNVAATITVHHQFLNHDDVGGYRMCPDNFCKPVAKGEEDRLALIEKATSGDPQFFYGSDSAPHPRSGKERGQDCCAGVYTHPVAPQLLAQVFAEAGALDKLRDFTSTFAARWYQLDEPPRQESLTLVEKPWQVPELIDGFAPFRAGQEIPWSVQ